MPPYWFHSYTFEIVTIVVYWFCGRENAPSRQSILGGAVLCHNALGGPSHDRQLARKKRQILCCAHTYDLRQHKNVLNQTLKLAQRDGLIQTNPADLVVMPHAAQFTGTFYTEAQMRDLLTAVKNERLYPIIYVTALYGLRRSEVLGLKWDSINFAMQTLTIRHTVPGSRRSWRRTKSKTHPASAVFL